MSAAVPSLLRALQSAVSVSHLYPPEHPRLVELVARTVAQANALTTERDLAIFDVDGQIVVEGEPLRDSEHLARGIFETLHRHGLHRITVRHGVTAAEALALVTALGESRRGAGSSPIASSEHIRLTALDAVAESVPRGAAGNGDFQPLVDVWNTILDERRCDMNAVELTAIALARTIDRHSGSLVTLATLKAHDDYTVTHITNVALLAMALGEAVDLSPAAVTDLGMAALLHDIGKLRVPAEILNAPGRLTDEQAAIIKRHPEDGARILLATPGVSELAVAVAYEHHVQYDGGGYPAVRPGWRLNLASAITTIADVYDALRSDRPYRKGLPPAEVHAIMSREAGTVFAPGLLQAFLSHVAPRTRIAPAAQPEPADRLSA